MKTPPRSPAELTQAFVAVFPALPRDFGVSGESVFGDAGPTYHSVVRDFTYFFEKNIEVFSDRQLRRLAELVVRCVTVGGDLGDAMETCLLGPTRRAHSGQRLEPFLSAE